MRVINTQKIQPRKSSWVNRLVSIVVTSCGFYTGSVLAATGMSIGQIATTVTSSFYGVAQLITAGSYIAGMGFALGAILKFKQHKDNPQQIPIGTPIALLFVAAALIFLPTIFGTANQTIFGGSGSVGGVTGVSTF